MSGGKQHPARPEMGRDRQMSRTDLQELMADERVAVIMDDRVARLHDLEAARLMKVTAGEDLKRFDALERMCRFLHLQRVDGAERAILVGGGTVGDAAGLAAHLVKRGMPVTMVPSTLLAAVDSSIGGKTAINASDGAKNVFGAYHFHDESLLVPELWKTLKREQILDGYSEAAKMALCLDETLARDWSRKMPAVEELVARGRLLKRAVCEQDPFEETGVRFVLNFGHTLGHVIESAHDFSISHGNCVAMGMRFSLLLGRRLGVTPDSAAEVANQLFDSFELPGYGELSESLADIATAEIEAMLKMDKKGNLNFVLLEEIGSAMTRTISPEELKDSLERARRGSHVQN